MIAYKIFSQRLIKERIFLGLSQEDVASALHIPLETYQSYEVGNCFPKRDLIKFARFFHVSVDYLLGLTPDK